MRNKMKMAIFLASVLLTVLGFNLIATYVYGDMVKGGNNVALELIISSSRAQIEKEPPNHIVLNEDR